MPVSPRIRKSSPHHPNPANDSDIAAITHYLQAIPVGAEAAYKQRAAQAILNFELDKPNQIPLPLNDTLDPNILRRLLKKPKAHYVAPQPHSFTFIDLFAGIGGFRIPFQQLGGRCIFSSEIDSKARAVYYANFDHMPFGDIRDFKNPKSEIPPHDILLAGFPCQTFSMIGRREGFLDETRGTLFYDIARILKAVRPKAFLLENVEGLINHDGGRTLDKILEVLRKDLKYFVPDWSILNAKDFGLAQHRKRIFIVGFDPDLGIDSFEYPLPHASKATIAGIREKKPVDQKYYIPEGYLETLRKHAAREKARGNGFGFAILENDEIANALVGGGSGRERNLIRDIALSDIVRIKGKHSPLNREGIRFMTPREWARLQGFKREFRFEDIVEDTRAYKLFANAVPINVVQAIGEQILKTLEPHLEKNKKNK